MAAFFDKVAEKIQTTLKKSAINNSETKVKQNENKMRVLCTIIYYDISGKRSEVRSKLACVRIFGIVTRQKYE